MSLSSCDKQPGLLEVEEALAQIDAAISKVQGHERVNLQSALDRVLAQDISAPFDVPPHRNSAMDGYALRAADLSEGGEIKLKIIGKSFAGAPFPNIVNEGECVRIMTGAVVPKGADTVVMQEHVTADETLATIPSAVKPGGNIRHPGEDMKAGTTVLKAGHLLTAADIGLIASLGIGEVTVVRRPRVAIFSTGDELKGIGQTLSEGDIYDSNRYTLKALLSRYSVEIIDLGVIPDDHTKIRSVLSQAANIADLVVTSGGVSVGEADFVKKTLDELGQVGFWRIAMKPGKPLAFGNLGKAFFLGLPGNPVSVMATFILFARPALMKLQGRAISPPLSFRAELDCNIRKSPGRRDYQRGILRQDDLGKLHVSTTGTQGSHVLSSMSKANCFIVIPRESGDAASGTKVEVIPFSGLI
jgi:molybdopterin molybdotransferase